MDTRAVGEWEGQRVGRWEVGGSAAAEGACVAMAETARVVEAAGTAVLVVVVAGQVVFQGWGVEMKDKEMVEVGVAAGEAGPQVASMAAASMAAVAEKRAVEETGWAGREAVALAVVVMGMEGASKEVALPAMASAALGTVAASMEVAVVTEAAATETAEVARTRAAAGARAAV
mgnify:CR=1 FL=1